MATSPKKTGHPLIRGILLLSLAGVFYFGYQALRDGTRLESKNPFEYNLDSFKKSSTIQAGYKEVQRMALDSQSVYGIAVGPDGKVYVSGDKSILILNPNGTVYLHMAVREPARCLAVDENNDLYAGMKDHVEVFNGSRVRKTAWESLKEKAWITSVAISPDHVFVADAGNRIVWKFDKAGNLRGRIGEKNEDRDVPGLIIPSPFFDVGVDPDGFLWMTNPGRFSLENYSENGDFRSTWGESSMELKGFCGCCNPTHFVILSDGSIVTSEKGIARIKVHNRLGELAALVAGPLQFQERTVGLDLARDDTDRIYALDPLNHAVRIFTRLPSVE